MFEKYTNSFLKDFNFNTLLGKFSNKKFMTFHKGDVLFTENSGVTDIYFILSGEVNLIKSNLKTGFEIVTVCGQGDIPGFYDALTNCEHSNTAFAMSDTNVFAVNVKELLQLVSSKDEFNLWALKYLSRKIEAIDNHSGFAI